MVFMVYTMEPKNGFHGVHHNEDNFGDEEQLDLEDENFPEDELYVLVDEDVDEGAESAYLEDLTSGDVEIAEEYVKSERGLIKF